MKQLLFITLLTYMNCFCSSIHEAAKAGDIARLEELLNQDPTLLENTDHDLNYTPLHSAICGVQPDTVKHLLSRGASIQALDKTQRNALHILVGSGTNKLSLCQTKEIENKIRTIGSLLIKAGASLVQKNSNRETPFDMAARYCTYPLFSAGLSANAKEAEDSPLCKVLRYTSNQIPAVMFQTATETLLRLGANPHIKRKTPSGPRSILACAIQNGQLPAAESLLIAGASVTPPEASWLLDYKNCINCEVTIHSTKCRSQKLLAKKRPAEECRFNCKDFFVTALACYDLYSNNLLAAYVTPEEFEKFQPAVAYKKMQLLTDPRYTGILLPQKQIAAQKRGLTLYQYLQFQKK